MKKPVRSCFGKFGNTECFLAFCDKYPGCSRIYWEWYTEYRRKMPLRDYVKEAMRKGRYKHEKKKAK